MAYGSIDYNFIPCSANKNVFFHSAGVWTFQGSLARHGSCPDLAGPLLALPAHLCPSCIIAIPLPQMDSVMGSLPPLSGPLVFLARWAPSAACCLQPPLQPLKGFGFLTTVENRLLCLQTQPHRSFHDIMSRGGGNIKGPGDHFLSRLGERV